jgi:hypothetical protein
MGLFTQKTARMRIKKTPEEDHNHTKGNWREKRDTTDKKRKKRKLTSLCCVLVCV